MLELYSWQERAGIYNMTIDVDAIGKERGNLIELPDPTLLTELPDEVADLFVKPMVYPTDRQEQDIAASTETSCSTAWALPARPSTCRTAIGSRTPRPKRSWTMP